MTEKFAGFTIITGIPGQNGVTVKNVLNNAITKLHLKNEDILTVWRNSIPDLDEPGKKRKEKPYNHRVFLRLALTGLEHESFEEQRSYLANLVAEQLSDNIPFSSIVNQLLLLKRALCRIINSDLEDKEKEIIHPLLDSEFCSWITVAAEEYAHFIKKTASREIKDIMLWDGSALDLIPFPVILVDISRKIRRVNKSWLESAEKSLEEIMGKTFKSICGSKLDKSFLKMIDKSIKSLEVDPAELGSNPRLPGAAVYAFRPIHSNDDVAGFAFMALPSRILIDSRIRLLINKIVKGDLTFGKLMSELRIEKRMQITELAAQAKHARGYFSNIENEKVIPSINAMKAIADILDPDGSKNLMLTGILNKIPADLLHHLPLF